MREYFCQPVTFLGILSIVLIAVWFLFVILKKCNEIKISLFILSHCLLYVDLFILNSSSGFYIVSSSILLLSLAAGTLNFVSHKKGHGKLSKFKFIYLFLSIHLVFWMILIPILRSAVSILSLRPWSISGSTRSVAGWAKAFARNYWILPWTKARGAANPFAAPLYGKKPLGFPCFPLSNVRGPFFYFILFLSSPKTQTI